MAQGPRHDPQAIRQRIELMERLLERSLTIPVINRPVGLDAILGLIPVAGDAIAALLGAYIVWEARNLGMSRWQLLRMTGRIGFDAALGAVPVVGDLFDFAYRSNSRNLKRIRQHLDRHYPGAAIITQHDRARS